jgi:flagellar operon protein
MADHMVNGIKVPFLPVGGVEKLAKKSSAVLPAERAFDTLLQRELDNVRFSKHAQQRLDERNIVLTDSDLSQLQSAVSKADAKGARESLVLLRDMAFIVSVANRTVVTAMDGESIHENVFTNIDSAVVVQNENNK